jgi:hypothetical protein
MVRVPSPFDPHAVSSLRRVVACLLTGHRPAPLRNRSSQWCRFTNSLIELDAVGRIQFHACHTIVAAKDFIFTAYPKR